MISACFDTSLVSANTFLHMGHPFIEALGPLQRNLLNIDIVSEAALLNVCLESIEEELITEVEVGAIGTLKDSCNVSVH